MKSVKVKMQKKYFVSYRCFRYLEIYCVIAYVLLVQPTKIYFCMTSLLIGNIIKEQTSKQKLLIGLGYVEKTPFPSALYAHWYIPQQILACESEVVRKFCVFFLDPTRLQCLFTGHLFTDYKIVPNCHRNHLKYQLLRPLNWSFCMSVHPSASVYAVVQ